MITMLNVPTDSGSNRPDQFKVSVIIAHYNAGSKIFKNLQQLANQTMSSDEFEVIIVDDKSPDGIENLEKFGNQIKNLNILVEPDNHGYPSIPRNHGIDLARGTFILIIDQDDYIAKETLQNMIDLAEDKSDVIIPKYAEGLNLRGSQLPFKNKTILDASVAIDNVLSTLAPHKMFRRSMLNKNNLRFFPSEYIPLAEDEVFVNRALACSRRTSILADQDYYYWVESEGHLALAKRYQLDEPWKGINVITEILKAIDKSRVYTLNEKNIAQAIYVGRFITRLQGGFFSVLNKMKSEKKKNDYITSLRYIFLKYISKENIKNIREFAQYIVIGIRQGLDYDGLVSLQKKILFDTDNSNIFVENGLIYRNVHIYSTKVKIPVNFLNKVTIRLISFAKLNNKYKFVISVQSDLMLPMETVNLIMKQRNSKKEFTLAVKKLENQQCIYSIDVSELDFYIKSSEHVTFDFYVDLLGKRRRLGKERNELMIDLESTVEGNKTFYITKGGYLALQLK